MRPVTHGPLQVLAVAVVLLPCTVADAGAQGLAKGVRGGLNLTNQQISADGDDTSLDWQMRPVFGGFVTWPLFSWLELQPEVLYSMKGGKQEEFDITSKLLLDYIEAPVLGRITRSAGGSRRFYVAAGPSFGWLIRARARIEFDGSAEELDRKEDTERFELGIVAAGGLELGSIVVDGRYTFGLTDVDSDDDFKGFNRAISLTVGFKF